jgi:hypothetical protein
MANNRIEMYKYVIQLYYQCYRKISSMYVSAPRPPCYILSGSKLYHTVRVMCAFVRVREKFSVYYEESRQSVHFSLTLRVQQLLLMLVGENVSDKIIFLL